MPSIGVNGCVEACVRDENLVSTKVSLGIRGRMGILRMLY